MNGEEEMRARLAEALWNSSHPTHLNAQQIARDLLPAVRAIVAEELRAAAVACDLPDDSRIVRPWLVDRAERVPPLVA